VLRSVLGVTQFPGERSSGVEPEHKDDLSHALSGEDCDTKHCSERQVQLQAATATCRERGCTSRGTTGLINAGYCR